MTIVERNEQLAKDANVKSVGAFNQDLPAPFTPGQTLVEGAIIEFPEAWTNDNVKSRTFNGKDYTFALLKMILPDGTETVYDFYPNSELRPGFEYKIENGKAVLVQTINNKGNLYEHMLSYVGKADKDENGTVITTATQKAMDALLGKKCKVAQLFKFQTVKFVDGKQTNELKDAYVHTINFVD